MTASARHPRAADPSAHRRRAVVTVWTRAVAIASLGFSCLVSASGWPPPRCAAVQLQPAFTGVGDAPAVRIWTPSTLADIPSAGDCAGWSAVPLGLLVAVAGRFRSDDDVAALLTRFGAISDLLTVRYWSVTDHAWRPLVTRATAVDTAAARQPRSDYTAAQLEGGRNVYMAQKDSRAASEAVYRMRVSERTVDGFVLETENVTPVRWFGVTLFQPGDIQSMYRLQQRDAGVWSYYALTQIAGSSWLITGHEKSYANRVVALYRHLAGIPSDLEPPAAP